MKKCRECGNKTILQNGLCGTCIGIKAHFKKIRKDINNADHPSRQKAIKIMEYIAGYIGQEDIFDCNEEKQTTTWYDVEDKLINIIEGKK